MNKRACEDGAEKKKKSSWTKPRISSNLSVLGPMVAGRRGGEEDGLLLFSKDLLKTS